MRGCLLTCGDGRATGAYYFLQVRDILASLMRTDPDQRMSVRELRDFALVGQLWGPGMPQAQQEQHAELPRLPDTTVKALKPVAAKLAGSDGK